MGAALELMRGSDASFDAEIEEQVEAYERKFQEQYELDQLASVPEQRARLVEQKAAEISDAVAPKDGSSSSSSSDHKHK